eukprot:11159212-Alexandrium_andersonii.AAC.1
MEEEPFESQGWDNRGGRQRQAGRRRRRGAHVQHQWYDSQPDPSARPRYNENYYHEQHQRERYQAPEWSAWAGSERGGEWRANAPSGGSAISATG